MKTPDHGILWLIARTALFLTIGFLSVFGLMYVIPFYTWMAKIDEQATAIVLLAAFTFCFTCVYWWARLTNRL